MLPGNSGTEWFESPVMRHTRTKIEGGSGGKRGHSNMTHWEYTEEVKRRTRKARRAEAKAIEKASVHSDHSTEQ